ARRDAMVQCCGSRQQLPYGIACRGSVRELRKQPPPLDQRRGGAGTAASSARDEVCVRRHELRRWSLVRGIECGLRALLDHRQVDIVEHDHEALAMKSHPTDAIWMRL